MSSSGLYGYSDKIGVFRRWGAHVSIKFVKHNLSWQLRINRHCFVDNFSSFVYCINILTIRPKFEAWWFGSELAVTKHTCRRSSKNIKYFNFFDYYLFPWNLGSFFPTRFGFSSNLLYQNCVSQKTSSKCPPPFFICGNNRKSNKIMHSVEKKLVWVVVLKIGPCFTNLSIDI